MMDKYKKLLILLCMVLFATLVNADDLEWADSFEQALQKAKKSDKIVMVFFEMQECPTCEYMKDVTFDNSSVSEYIETNFIPVAIDIYKDKAPAGLKAYGSPTTYFLDKNGNKIGRQIVGGMRAGDFLEQLKKYKAMSQK